MPMWLIWVVLIVAAAGYLGWVGLRLVRAGKALTAELARSSQVVEQLETRIAELEAVAEQAGPLRPAAMLTDAELEEVRERRRTVKRVRRARKLDRFHRASSRWDEISGE